MSQLYAKASPQPQIVCSERYAQVVKQMRTILLIILVGISVSCEKTSVRGVNLLGEWEKMIRVDALATGIIYDFKEGNSLIISKGVYADTLEYELLFNNSIHIVYESMDDTYEIVTYSNDSIEIMGFSRSPIPEEYNTLLVRR